MGKLISEYLCFTVMNLFLKMKPENFFNPSLFISILLSVLWPFKNVSSQNSPESDGVKTIFQTASPWKPTLDVRADAALIYGVRDHGPNGEMTFEERVKSWQDKGYITHFMTGIAWGGYQDYFSGE